MKYNRVPDIYNRLVSKVCLMKTVPPATCVLLDSKFFFIERVYTEGTVFMIPAVVSFCDVPFGLYNSEKIKWQNTFYS